MASGTRNEEKFGDRLQQYVADNGKLSIFMVGNVGSGKSTLVNSLLGWEAATPGASLEAVTKQMDNFDGLVRMQRPIGNVATTVWDSPGLQDPDSKENLLQNIKDKCSDVDLVVYCIRMTKTRLDAGEVESMCDITKTLGPSVWEKTLFVLTFANQLELPIESNGECNLQEYYYRKKEEWSRLLRRHLKERAKVDANIVEGVRIVAAGYGKEPLSYLQKDGDWYQEFWLTCCETVLFDSLPSLIILNRHFRNNAKNSVFFSNFLAKKMAEDQASAGTFLSVVQFGAESLGLGYQALGEILLRSLQSSQPSLELHSQGEV